MNMPSSGKRWYDQDPTLSLAISLLRNASHNSQEYICSYIIDSAKLNGIDIEQINPKKGLLFFKRWYDKEDSLFNAIESLRLLSDDIRKEISLEIIDKLCDICCESIEEVV